MMMEKRISILQKQALLTAKQVETIKQYVQDNCQDKVWKDIFLTELNVIHARMQLMNQACTEALLETIKKNCA